MLTKSNYKLIATECSHFIWDMKDIPKEQWGIEEWMSTKDVESHPILRILFDEHVIKRTHKNASIIALQTEKNPIGMSLSSDGCFNYIKNKLK